VKSKLVERQGRKATGLREVSFGITSYGRGAASLLAYFHRLAASVPLLMRWLFVGFFLQQPEQHQDLFRIRQIAKHTL
jgi:hypothetical protein